MNLKVKYRESFRPFAPSILKEDLTDWFDIKSDSPYMLMVAEVNKKKCLEMNISSDYEQTLKVTYINSYGKQLKNLPPKIGKPTNLEILK